MNSTKTTNKAAKGEKNEPQESFLTETQLEGRANAAAKDAVGKMSLDDALKSFMKIRQEENIAQYMESDSWPELELALYCQDCRNICPKGKGWTLRGNPRLVCGACGGKKVAQGKAEALKKYYHVPKDSEVLMPQEKFINPEPFDPSSAKRFASKARKPRNEFAGKKNRSKLKK